MKGISEFQLRTSLKSGRDVPVLRRASGRIISLPEPEVHPDSGLFATIKKRRSRRKLKGGVSARSLSLIMWAASGITLKKRYVSLRAAPSAGALYSVENYVSVQHVDDIPSGFYRYLPEDHALESLFDENPGPYLKRACLDQPFVGSAAFNVVWTAVVERFIYHYGERGWRYVYMDAGHIAENAFLAAEALGLGACPVGAFFDDEVIKLFSFDEGEFPIYILSVGERGEG